MDVKYEWHVRHMLVGMLASPDGLTRLLPVPVAWPIGPAFRVEAPQAFC